MTKVIYLATQHSSQTGAVLLAQLTIDHLIDHDAYTGSEFETGRLNRVVTDDHIVDRPGKIRFAVRRDSDAGKSLLAGEWEATQTKFYQTYINEQETVSSSTVRPPNGLSATGSIDETEYSTEPVILFCTPRGVSVCDGPQAASMLDELDKLWIVPVEVYQ